MYLFTLLSLFLVSYGYSQTNDCSEQKSEIEKLNTSNGKLNSELTKKDGVIESQVQELSKLKTQNNYFKETLDLLNTPNSKEGDKVMYRINTVEGDLSVGIITITGTIENLSIVKRWQSKKIKIIDLKGNAYNGRLRFNDGTWSIAQLQKNIPIKFTVTFNKILEEAQVLRALMFDMYGANGKGHIVTIKNLDVQWQ